MAALPRIPFSILLLAFFACAPLRAYAQEASATRTARLAATPDRRPVVAVLYFDHSGTDASLEVLRKGLAQMLISDLASVEGVRIVERARLQELLDEAKLSHTTHFDPKTALRIGKQLGAHYLVLGSYLDLLGKFRINADFVNVETGTHATGTSAVGKPDDFLDMERTISAALAKAIADHLIEGSSDEPPRGAAGISRARGKQPTQLKLRTVVSYSKALDAIDRGDRATAKTELQAVVKEQPDFALAAADLDRLMR
jgi:TolB-like protein